MLIYGGEYEFGPRSKEFFGEEIYHQDVPCAVCKTKRPNVLMIPGWTMEYKGYLVGGHHAHPAASAFICLDGYAEVIYDGAPYSISQRQCVVPWTVHRMLKVVQLQITVLVNLYRIFIYSAWLCWKINKIVCMFVYIVWVWYISMLDILLLCSCLVVPRSCHVETCYGEIPIGKCLTYPNLKFPVDVLSFSISI